MATGTPASKPPGAQDKAALQKAIDNVGWRLKELKSFDVSRIRERWDPRLEAVQKKVNTTLADALGVRTPDYKQYAIGALDGSIDTMFGDRYSPGRVAAGDQGRHRPGDRQAERGQEAAGGAAGGSCSSSTPGSCDVGADPDAHARGHPAARAGVFARA